MTEETVKRQSLTADDFKARKYVSLKKRSLNNYLIKMKIP